jgi:di/tricarboxylate transporter
MEKALLFTVLAATLALFAWDRFRYEMVALAAMLVLVVAGLVPPADAFSGFGHPAVVTVAAVLIMTRGLANSGVADLLARPIARLGGSPVAMLAVLTVSVAALSAFINNVGALALLMPVAIRLARDHQQPPSRLLMPMAFASLLGGLVTAIGTPPNLIVAGYREQLTGSTFRIFDYTAVGFCIAAAGLLFLILLGWRLLPRRQSAGDADVSFNLSGYMTEVRVPREWASAGIRLAELEEKFGEGVKILGVLRGERRIGGHRGDEPVWGGDVLVLRGKADDLKRGVDPFGFELTGRGEDTENLLKSDALQVVEAVVLPDAWAAGRTARALDLRRRFGLNLLAISRQGAAHTRSLADERWRAGDVLLLEGDRLQLPDMLAGLGCLPLAARDVRIGQPRRILAAVGLLAAAVAVAAVGWVPIHIAFTGCVLAMALTDMFSAREAYRAVDWPVIVLLAAMIPIGQAMESSGAAAWLAGQIGGVASVYPAVVGLGVILVVTMCLSDVVNNAAAAILMCPIAAGVAAELGVSADPFLMAVAVGASCAFLTPVGHQSNTLVMGPGGYRFGDYWRVGLPLEILVGLVAIIVIPLVWPFAA